VRDSAAVIDNRKGEAIVDATETVSWTGSNGSSVAAVSFS
jgi:hypothetical protein